VVRGFSTQAGIGAGDDDVLVRKRLGGFWDLDEELGVYEGEESAWVTVGHCSGRGRLYPMLELLRRGKIVLEIGTMEFDNNDLWIDRCNHSERTDLEMIKWHVRMSIYISPSQRLDSSSGDNETVIVFPSRRMF